MKNHFLRTSILLVLVAMTGCSPVQFYSDSGLSHKSGLKYYTVKPYLVVERELSGNNVVKAEIVYVPDLENPQYLAFKNGFGSRKVDLKLTDGAITSFGLASEPLIAESVEALSALISKSASAAKDLSTLKGVPPGASVVTVTELYELIMTDGKTTVRKIEIK